MVSNVERTPPFANAVLLALKLSLAEGTTCVAGVAGAAAAAEEAGEAGEGAAAVSPPPALTLRTRPRVVTIFSPSLMKSSDTLMADEEEAAWPGLRVG